MARKPLRTLALKPASKCRYCNSFSKDQEIFKAISKKLAK